MSLNKEPQKTPATRFATSLGIVLGNMLFGAIAIALTMIILAGGARAVYWIFTGF